MKSSSKKNKTLFFMTIVGAICGTLVGDVLGTKFKSLDFLKYSYNIGTPKILNIDLKVISLTFGINFYVNLVTILFIVLVVIFIKKLT